MKMDEKLKNAGDESGSQIARMFAGSTVFLTGGTGFLGKQLIEKLLRSCPDVKKIYLLLRPKKNKNIEQRTKEQFEDVLYDKLRLEMSDFMEKISTVDGDAGQLHLGMSEEHRTRIVNEVEFIFHGAATVRFDEELKKAVNINVRGTREVMILARSCTKLRALVHLSTAYSNCPIQEIDEKFYNISIPGEELIQLTESVDEKTLTAITPGLLGDFPNTYAYSKSAAESIVQKYSKGLPVAVVRPSIVISTAEQPLPGWTDNIYGPTGILVAAALGLLHVMKVDLKALTDLVPSDYAVNNCIAVAWKTAREHCEERETSEDHDPTVYNYVSFVERPLTWDLLLNYCETSFKQSLSCQALWMYFLILTKYEFVYNLCSLFLHWIPAYIIDAILIVIGKKPMLRKVYTKIDKAVDLVSYFSRKQWVFHNNNTRNLYKELCSTDQRTFNFNMAALRWQEYFETYVRGIRLYLLKELPETVPQAKRKQMKLKMLHYFCLSLILFGLYKLTGLILTLF